MSTYLVCFIVSDFQYTEDYILPDSDNITFRVYATPAQLEKTNYAREIGKKVIEYYIDYFGIKFPLPKLGSQRITESSNRSTFSKFQIWLPYPTSSREQWNTGVW